MPDDDEDNDANAEDLTPVDTPEARRKSGQTGAADCPICENDDEKKKTCAFCSKTGKVTHFKRAEWELEQGKSMDRCPDTERNDR